MDVRMVERRERLDRIWLWYFNLIINLHGEITKHRQKLSIDTTNFKHGGFIPPQTKN